MLGVDEPGAGTVAPPDAESGPGAPEPAKKAPRKTPRRQAADDQKPAKAPDDAQLLDDLLD